jgi:hypothetical protein
MRGSENGWYRVTFSAEDVAFGKDINLTSAFLELFRALGSPEGCSLFSGPELWVRDYYFSPDAANLAMPLIQSYAGIACSAPRKSAIDLVIGRAGVEGIRFAPEC